MGKKVIAFGASNSKDSINKKLATFAGDNLQSVSTEVLDLNDFEMPIFSIDREKEGGIPDLAHQFKAKINEADGIIISFAEHNGAYSAAYKNIYDWVSRIDMDVWMGKPMFLLATSPGRRGGQSVLDLAVNSYKYSNKNTIANFSLPSFQDNFSEKLGVVDKELKEGFEKQLELFNSAL